MGAETFADVSFGLQRDVAGGSVQVWSVIGDLGDAVEQTLKLQVLK